MRVIELFKGTCGQVNTQIYENNFKLPYGLVHVYAIKFRAVPWLRRLVVGLSLWKPRVNLRLSYWGFVVVNVALGQVSVHTFRFFHC